MNVTRRATVARLKEANMFRIMCGGLLAATVALAGSINVNAADVPALVGSWHVTVNLVDCNTGAPRPPFHSLLTFGSDGTMLETTDNAAFKPGQRSPGHGVWRRIRGTSFSAYSDALILFSSPASAAPPAPPFTRGFQRITQAIDIDPRSPDMFTSNATVEFFDEAGTLLMSGCATATGARFE